jgi:hypothetical protein
MKRLLPLLLSLAGGLQLSFGDESPRDVAVGVIKARQEGTITIYGENPSAEDRVALEARTRLERFLVSDNADETLTISYAIILIDQELSMVNRIDSTGESTSRLKAQKKALARRLIEIDNAEQNAAGQPANRLESK